MPIMQVENLSKIFRSGTWPISKPQEYVAVNSISFELLKGEILGFLGTNGAGKTTTIQMLLGVLTPTSGTIKYFGKDFSTHQTQVLKKVTYASGYDKLPARLTIWENLDVVGRIFSLPNSAREARIEHLLKFFGMWEMRNKPTGMLSAGQATRIILAKAFLPNPEIVLLDEPTAALDPEAAREVRAFVLQQQRENNVSILFTSHNMDEVTQVCDRVLVMKQGTIIANNTPEQLARSVSKSHVHLIAEDKTALINFLEQNQYTFKPHEHEIEIEVDEHAIASLLMALARNDMAYSQISIDKPTLEDYFLSISKK